MSDDLIDEMFAPHTDFFSGVPGAGVPLGGEQFAQVMPSMPPSADPLAWGLFGPYGMNETPVPVPDPRPEMAFEKPFAHDMYDTKKLFDLMYSHGPGLEEWEFPNLYDMVKALGQVWDSVPRRGDVIGPYPWSFYDGIPALGEWWTYKWGMPPPPEPGSSILSPDLWLNMLDPRFNPSEGPVDTTPELPQDFMNHTSEEV